MLAGYDWLLPVGHLAVSWQNPVCLWRCLTANLNVGRVILVLMMSRFVECVIKWFSDLLSMSWPEMRSFTDVEQTSMARELQFAGWLVNCSRWLDLRPRNSSCPAWSLFLVLTVCQCQWTAGVAWPQWQRLPESCLTSTSASTTFELCVMAHHLDGRWIQWLIT